MIRSRSSREFQWIVQIRDADRDQWLPWYILDDETTAREQIDTIAREHPDLVAQGARIQKVTVDQTMTIMG